MNSTVSGLLSRTFYRSDIIGPADFHGAAFYKELLSKDLTYTFINAVESCFPDVPSLLDEGELSMSGMDEVKVVLLFSLLIETWGQNVVYERSHSFCLLSPELKELIILKSVLKSLVSESLIGTMISGGT